MLEKCPDWKFLLDTYWVEFAGYSAVEYAQKVGGARLTNIHFKDLAKDEKRSICACGQGTLDFTSIYNKCVELGVENVLVEQDNAADLGDPMDQMQLSFNHLRPIIK
jgi:sugar phosphate isomerase/epimerase